jgi:hypothetical protein
VSIETLIAALQGLIDAGLPPGSAVYVREKTSLNGAGWVSPRYIRPGWDPHPVSAANDGTLVVFIS